MSDLTNDQVNERLISYEPAETTNELYEFGKILVSECTDRVHRLDAKTTTIAGYCGTIIALLLATFNVWKATIDGWAAIVVFLGALSCFIAAFVALRSLAPMTYDWFSDGEWFEEDYLADPDRLRRYHVLAMHNVVQAHEITNKKKTRAIKMSQRFMGFGAALFLVALANAVWKRVGQFRTSRPSQPSLGRVVLTSVEAVKMYPYDLLEVGAAVGVLFFLPAYSFRFFFGPSTTKRLALGSNLAEILRAAFCRSFAALTSESYSVRILFSHA